jgi:hypothetical protein
MTAKRMCVDLMGRRQGQLLQGGMDGFFAVCRHPSVFVGAVHGREKKLHAIARIPR